MLLDSKSRFTKKRITTYTYIYIYKQKVNARILTDTAQYLPSLRSVRPIVCLKYVLL